MAGGDNSDSVRDQRGRFLPGNPGGPGGSRRRAFTLRRAAEEAITPEHVQAIVRKATRMALEGNLTAARLVLDRTSGRPAEAPIEAEPLDIELPRMHTAADCNLAIEKLIHGICQGTIDRDAAKVLIDAIHTRLKGIEVNELDVRLTELEKTAGTVETGASRNRRR